MSKEDVYYDYFGSSTVSKKPSLKEQNNIYYRFPMIFECEIVASDLFIKKD